MSYLWRSRPSTITQLEVRSRLDSEPALEVVNRSEQPFRETITVLPWAEVWLLTDQLLNWLHRTQRFVVVGQDDLPERPAGSDD